jgi:peptidoglycan L-alanyl-D-glutamate endopeptidase CwlK
MPSRKLEDLNSTLVSAWERAEKEFESSKNNKVNVIITCTHRTCEEQNELYAQGRTVKGQKVTNAKCGQSLHNKYPSLAFDIAFLKLDKTLDWSEDNFHDFANIIKKIEPRVEWGGEWKFKDMPHFQLKQ